MPWFGVTCKHRTGLCRKRHAEVFKYSGFYLLGAATARDDADQLPRRSQLSDR
jgi:hypothetical protein